MQPSQAKKWVLTHRQKLECTSVKKFLQKRLNINGSSPFSIDNLASWSITIVCYA
jgi:hypothetical protein